MRQFRRACIAETLDDMHEHIQADLSTKCDMTDGDYLDVADRVCLFRTNSQASRGSLYSRSFVIVTPEGDRIVGFRGTRRMCRRGILLN